MKMYEITLLEGEIINYNKLVRIEIDHNVHIVGLVITNMHIMLFEKGKPTNLKDMINHIKYKTDNSYKQILKEEIKNLKCSYIGENTVIQTKEKTIHVLGEKVPLPIL